MLQVLELAVSLDFVAGLNAKRIQRNQDSNLIVQESRWLILEWTNNIHQADWIDVS